MVIFKAFSSSLHGLAPDHPALVPFVKAGSFVSTQQKFGQHFQQFSVVPVIKIKPKYRSQLGCSKGGDKDLEKSLGNDSLAHGDENSLEVELQAAIRSENYGKAAQLRDELRVLQEDNRAAVIAANGKFYKAFELGDLKLMRSIWAPRENVHCIHPGAGRISGYDLVVASWELMLGPETGLPLRIDLQNVEVHVHGNFAFVTCLEVVRTSGSSWGKQLATNIFERLNGNWYICVHHASHITL